MSGLDGLQLDADGYLDMDQFPDDGTDLAGPELDQLREVLHADPVEEPTPEQWDAMFDDVVATGDAGPFALDDGDLPADDVDAPSPSDDAVDATDDLDRTDDDVSSDEVGVADELDGFDLDTTGAEDPDLDAGLDLADGAVDDAYTSDDGPSDIAGNDFEDLL